MTTTLFTSRIPKVGKSRADFVKTTIPLKSQKMKGELRKVITKLERQDIGWIDILKAMANVADQQDDEQVTLVLETGARELKRNRKVVRDL